MTQKRILHLHSTFALGGKEARAVRLMNLFGDKARHTILSAAPEWGARDAIAPEIAVDFPTDAPSLQGKPSPFRYRTIARYMQQFDLVLSYNWGSMDGMGAHRLWSPFMKLPPIIHHEDGFNSDEAERLNPKRNMFRKLMLPSAQAVVVPSQRLEGIAGDVWGVPTGKLHRIPNGIDVGAYTKPPAADAIPGFTKGDGDVVIGTLAGLRSIKNLPRLVRAFATLPENCRLVIVGEGPERAAIIAEAERLDVASRLHMPGFLAEPHRYVGLFDIFALSSDSEQFPISLVEAMAAGVPAVSTDVGDVRNIVAPANHPFVVPLGDDAGYAVALNRLVADKALRTTVGEANRSLAVAHYDEAQMVARYAALYGIDWQQATRVP